MRYTHLTPEHQVQMLTERLLQLEAQHYQHECNKQQIRAQAEEGTPEVKETARVKVAEIENQQAALDVAYAADLATREALEPKKLNAEKPKVK